MAHSSSRAVSLRYLAVKLAHALDAAAAQLRGGSLPDAVASGVAAYRQQLTSVMLLAGAAMAPTLNPKAAKEVSSDATESLLLRLIPRPSGRTVFTGDVVAFNSPFAASGVEPNVLVRRVVAVEGDEMASDDPEDAEFSIPAGHCWVLADNEELQPPLVIDSRSFGPLPFASIVGRVVYSARSAVNHGPIENSEEALKADAPVLEAELDIDRLMAGPGEAEVGEGGEGGEQQGRQ